MPGSYTKGRTEAVINSRAKGICCPFCKQITSVSDFLHTADFSVLVRNAKIARLSQFEATAFSYLVKNKESTNIDRLIVQLYANRNEPSNARGVIYVVLLNLRRKLRPLKIEIANISRNYVVQFCES